MKKQLLLFVLMLLPLVASADAVEINGIYYNLNSETKEAQVLYNSNYSGNIILPESVNYDGTKYSVTSIGLWSFSGCSELTSITIPNSVTEIGDQAFVSCSGLTSIVVENGNSKYDSRNNCNAIIETATNKLLFGCMNTIIPNDVTSIGYWSFYDCSGLTSVTIPRSVTEIGRNAFMNCSGLTSIVVENGNSKYDSRNNCNAIIKTESNELLYGCNNTIIPSDVTSIGSSAFSGRSSLTSVTIPNSVTSIGDKAFQECTGLTSVTIPNSVTFISSFTFDGCSGLISIVIPNSVKQINEYAFRGCTGLTSVTIGNSVTNIGESAFHGCSSLASVSIPNSVTYIGRSAFQGCSGLTSITIPNSVTTIGSGAFSGCSITSITIPSSVTSIEGQAFSGCSGLTSIKVESGNKKYDSRDNCNAIIHTTSNMLISGCKNTIIPNSVTSIGSSAFQGCSDLTSVTIPNGVTTINGSAFRYCSGLTSVIIPNSVKTIVNSAFQNCSELTSVTIGSAVKKINGKAFANCPNLETVKCLAEDVPSTFSDIFADSNPQNATLYVPAGSIDAYKATAPWNEFGTILTLDEETGIELPYSDYLTIQSDGGMLTIQGADDGTKVGVYNINGTLAGEGICRNGCATVNTNLQPGSVAIIKIGDRSVKYVVK